ncbi:MAG: leucyl/phenylalanyl-tRNA--protein transferase [Pseudomonadota bacterium]
MAELTPDLLLQAYGIGIFPMAEHRADREVFWVDPRRRGILPLDGFHASRSLRRAMRKASYDIGINTDFDSVVAACADRSETWINDEISSVYSQLHQRGHAHSLEILDAGTLVGGVYGVALGGAFFGESMFSRRPNTSKMALAALVERLSRGGFTLFDTQFLTEHLASLGAIEVSRSHFHGLLEHAKRQSASFTRPAAVTLQEVAQRMTQTS